MASFDVCAKITEAIEAKKCSCCIFLDFAKAFDTVDQSILSSKLEYYCIRSVPLDWFKSYLNDRSQKVFVGVELSCDLHVKCGSIPQGGVLVPLLFLLYINYIPEASKVSNFHLCADDTSLLYSHENLNIL